MKTELEKIAFIILIGILLSLSPIHINFASETGYMGQRAEAFPPDVTVPAQVNVEQYQVIEIPVQVQNVGSDEIVSYECTFTIDKDFLGFSTAEVTGTLSEQGQFESNIIGNQMHIAWASSSAISSDGVLFTLKLLAQEHTTAPTLVTASDIRFNAQPYSQEPFTSVNITEKPQDFAMSISDHTVEQRRDVLVPVMITGPSSSMDLVSYQFDVSFDDEIIYFIDVVKEGTLSEQFTINYHILHNKVIIAASCENGITQEGTLVYLKFMGKNIGDSPLSMSDIYVNKTQEAQLPSSTITVIENHIQYSVSAQNIEVPTQREFLFDISLSSLNTTNGNYAALSDGDKAVSYQFEINYDFELLHFNGYSKANTLLSDQTEVQISNSNGKLYVSCAADDIMAGNLPVLKLRFVPLKAGVADFTVVNPMMNRIPCQVANHGSVTIVDTWAEECCPELSFGKYPTAVQTMDPEDPSWDFDLLVRVGEIQEACKIISYQFTLNFDPDMLIFVAPNAAGTASGGMYGIDANKIEPGKYSVGAMSENVIIAENEVFVKLTLRAYIQNDPNTFKSRSTHLTINDIYFNESPCPGEVEGDLWIVSWEEHCIPRFILPCEDFVVPYQEERDPPVKQLFNVHVELDKPFKQVCDISTLQFILHFEKSLMYFEDCVINDDFGNAIDYTVLVEDDLQTGEIIFNIENPYYYYFSNTGLLNLVFSKKWGDKNPVPLHITDVKVNGFEFPSRSVYDGCVLLAPKPPDPPVNVCYRGLHIDDLQVGANQEFNIPVEIDYINKECPVISYQFDLMYENDKIEFIGFDINGTLSEDGNYMFENIESNQANINQVRFAYMVPDEAITHGGDLLILKFRSLDKSAVAEIKCDKFIFNRGTEMGCNNIVTITNPYDMCKPEIALQAVPQFITLNQQVEFKLNTGLLHADPCNIDRYSFGVQFDQSKLSFNSYSVDGSITPNVPGVFSYTFNDDDVMLCTINTNGTTITGEGQLISLVFDAMQTGEAQVSLWGVEIGGQGYDDPLTSQINILDPGIDCNVSIQASNQTVGIGQDFEVPLQVSTIHPSCGFKKYTANILYDPEYISFDGIRDDGALVGPGLTTFNLNQPGDLTIEYIQEDQVIQGTGDLVYVQFTARKLGYTPIDIQSFDFIPYSMNDLTGCFIDILEEPELCTPDVYVFGPAIGTNQSGTVEIHTDYLPVSCTDFFECTLTFDPSIITYSNYNTSGSILTSPTVLITQPASGQLRITCTNSGNISGSGKLLNLVFQSGATEGKSALKLSNWKYSPSLLNPNTHNGYCTVSSDQSELYSHGYNMNSCFDDVIIDQRGMCHGEVKGGTKTTGHTLQGVQLDGIDDHINIPYSPFIDLKGNQAFTISFWLRVPESRDCIIFQRKDALTGNEQYYLKYTSGADLVQFAMAGDEEATTRSNLASVLPEKWTFVTIVGDGAEVVLFTGGNQSDAGSAQYSNIANIGNTAGLTIGKKEGMEPFKGKIDDLRFYGHALSHDVIIELASEVFYEEGCDISSYLQVQKNRYNGSIVTLSDDVLRFRYAEEYHDDDGYLAYKVFNWKREELVLDDLEVEFGINYYDLDVSSLSSGIFSLEVVNGKNEKYYLKFNKQ